MACADFPAIFDRLRRILQAHAEALVVIRDEPADFRVDSTQTRSDGYVFAFGAVRIGARYVSYHLPPVHVWPDLLDDCPEALRRRMQGKSCFNLSRPDDALFVALEDLTRRARERLDTSDAFAV